MSDGTDQLVCCLLVDDREENLVALEALLSGEGVTLLKAHSGPEALELLLRHDVALALIDVQMPDMDGFELAELMRGSERTRGVTIIFLTAGATDQQSRFRGYEAGAVDFLQKPLETEVLQSKVGVFIDLYRQRQEVARQRDELSEMMKENARLLEQSRRDALALQEADRRKDEFLATLAHELRNPLAPLLNSVQVLNQLEVSPTEARNIYDIIDRQVAHMVHLVNDLLEVSRISTGRIELEKTKTDVADVVRNAVETSRPLLDSFHHHLTVEVPSEPLVVEGDSVRLTQVLANLLNNAAKYTPEGGKVKLSVKRDDAWIHIRVEDSGLGIPQEMLDRVFEMFTQVEHHTGNSQGGLGIGLTLVKRLVNLHGGSVDVESPGKNRGSTFTVRLPAHEGARSHTNKVVQRQANGSVRRVLLIDKDEGNLATLQMLLQECGHQVATAQSAIEGIARAATFQPEFAVFSISDDVMNYDEAARRLRDLPAAKNVVLIALADRVEDELRLKERGFDGQLIRPVTAASFTAIFDSAELQSA